MKTQIRHPVSPKTRIWTNCLTPDLGSYLPHCCWDWDFIFNVCICKILPGKFWGSTSWRRKYAQCAFPSGELLGHSYGTAGHSRPIAAQHLLGWVLPLLLSPLTHVLWLAAFTLRTQPLPSPCIPLTIQRILKHNTICFSVLVKIYEHTKCLPAGNYSPLENAFAESWNLIRKQSRILRGSQPHILLFQRSNHPNLGEQDLWTCKGWLLCFNRQHT